MRGLLFLRMNDQNDSVRTGECQPTVRLPTFSLSLVKETFVSLAEILFEGVNAYRYIIETSKEREICVPGRLETCLEAIIIETRLKERCSKMKTSIFISIYCRGLNNIFHFESNSTIHGVNGGFSTLNILVRVQTKWNRIESSFFEFTLTSPSTCGSRE